MVECGFRYETVVHVVYHYRLLEELTELGAHRAKVGQCAPTCPHLTGAAHSVAFALNVHLFNYRLCTTTRLFCHAYLLESGYSNLRNSMPHSQTSGLNS